MAVPAARNRYCRYHMLLAHHPQPTSRSLISTYHLRSCHPTSHACIAYYHTSGFIGRVVAQSRRREGGEGGSYLSTLPDVAHAGAQRDEYAQCRAAAPGGAEQGCRSAERSNVGGVGERWVGGASRQRGRLLLTTVQPQGGRWQSWVGW